MSQSKNQTLQTIDNGSKHLDPLLSLNKIAIESLTVDVAIKIPANDFDKVFLLQKLEKYSLSTL